MGLQILTAALTGWFFAQLIKVILTLLKHKRFDLKRFIESGGMPSSHSAMVIALTTSLGRHEGINSSAFAVALVFSLIVMYDASGVRRAAGKQAEILNQIIQDIYHHKYKGGMLKELIGHTPLEVLGGVVVGIIVGFCI